MKVENIEIIQGQKIEILELSLIYVNCQLELLLKIIFRNKKFILCFYNVSRINIHELSAPMEIQGFQMINNREKGWEQESNYTIRDFEDDSISFFCENYVFYSVY